MTHAITQVLPLLDAPKYSIKQYVVILSPPPQPLPTVNCIWFSSPPSSDTVDVSSACSFQIESCMQPLQNAQLNVRLAVIYSRGGGTCSKINHSGMDGTVKHVSY